jgi:hypothetical protein
MSNYTHDDAAESAVGDLGNGLDGLGQPEQEADPNTDLMRADEDPLPDAQVPGIGPDGQAPNTPA